MAAVAVPDLSATRYELACGARLIVAPRPGAAVTAMQVHLRGGHSLDEPELAGTATFAGALLDSGTKSHTEDQLDERLESVGGSLSGDARGIGGSVASQGWRTLAETLCELLTEPAYPKREFQRERTRVLAASTSSAPSPASKLRTASARSSTATTGSAAPSSARWKASVASSAATSPPSIASTGALRAH